MSLAIQLRVFSIGIEAMQHSLMWHLKMVLHSTKTAMSRREWDSLSAIMIAMGNSKFSRHILRMTRPSLTAIWEVGLSRKCRWKQVLSQQRDLSAGEQACRTGTTTVGPIFSMSPAASILKWNDT